MRDFAEFSCHFHNVSSRKTSRFVGFSSSAVGAETKPRSDSAGSTIAFGFSCLSAMSCPFPIRFSVFVTSSNRFESTIPAKRQSYKLPIGETFFGIECLKTSQKTPVWSIIFGPLPRALIDNVNHHSNGHKWGLEPA